MSTTVNYSWDIPTVGGDINTWGGLLNAIFTNQDELLGGDFPIDGIDIDSGTINGVTGGADSWALLAVLEETTEALSGTTPDLDLSLGSNFTLTTSGNTTIAVTSPPTDAWVATLLVTLGGAHTLTITGADYGDPGAPNGLASGDKIELTLRGVGATFRVSETWRDTA